MKAKTVLIEIELPIKAVEELEKFASHRNYHSFQQYLAEAIHAKIAQMIDYPVIVDFKVKEE